MLALAAFLLRRILMSTLSDQRPGHGDPACCQETRGNAHGSGSGRTAGRPPGRPIQIVCASTVACPRSKGVRLLHAEATRSAMLVITIPFGRVRVQLARHLVRVAGGPRHAGIPSTGPWLSGCGQIGVMPQVLSASSTTCSSGSSTSVTG
jgi:hypothetical protein